MCFLVCFTKRRTATGVSFFTTMVPAKASASDSPLWNRSSGSFAMHRSTTRASERGTAGATDVRFGGGVRMWRARSSDDEGAENGGWPAMAKKAVTPNE